MVKKEKSKLRQLIEEYGIKWAILVHINSSPSPLTKLSSLMLTVHSRSFLPPV